MKPFDLELAKKGYPVCSRRGEDVRIICWDASEYHPIIGLISHGIYAIIMSYDDNGKTYDHNFELFSDLMMK
jgi:hypothetical protein